VWVGTSGTNLKTINACEADGRIHYGEVTLYCAVSRSGK
jgi:hypothetical protein